MLVAALALSTAQASEVLQPPEQFVADAFAGTPPQPEKLWLTGKLQQSARNILDRTPPASLTYWKQGSLTVWVLEQIGKYKPITTGLVIEAGAIAQIKVLVYRESHGWEVKYPFFTDQFIGAKLENMQEYELDTSIDGIAGATLSVRALVKLARLALLLDHEVRHGGT